MTSGTSSFAATDYNGTLSYAFAKSTGFEISNQEPAGNITAVTFEFQSTGGYIFDRSYKLATTEVEGGWKYAVPDATGSSSLSFSVYSGPIYISRITVEYIDGTGGGGGGEVGTTYSIDDFMISYFNCGTVETLPIAIYSMTRKKVSPEIYALSTIMFVVILSIILISNAMESRGYRRDQRALRGGDVK